MAKAIHLFSDRSSFKVSKADLLAVDDDRLLLCLTSSICQGRRIT
ncbi:MAG: hypothetical protein PUP90_29480 [Nostoc sp. S4]|nr:hypothetical protein [Nostoc sp. S4]